VVRTTQAFLPLLRASTSPVIVNVSSGLRCGARPPGRLPLALAVTVRDGRIARYDLIADPARLRELDLAVLGEAAENRDGRQPGCA
jgi:hypothetical protein